MNDEMPFGRRRFLKLAGSSATMSVAALAGCAGSARVAPGSDTMSLMANQTGLPTTVGGPNDLKEEYEVKMVAMKGNEGHGFAFFPSVLWLKPGGTVSWEHSTSGPSKAVSHTVTAFNSKNEKPQYTPKGSKAFDSGVLNDVEDASALKGRIATHKNGYRGQTGFGGAWKVTFDAPGYPKGVYLYFCEDHDFLGMAGAIVVGDVGPGDDGWSPGMTAPLKEEFPQPLHDRLTWVRNQISSKVKQ